MTIHLSGQREQLILSLMRAGKFTSADEVHDEALRLMSQRYQGPEEGEEPAAAGVIASPDRTSRRLENLKRLGRKPDAMPTAPIRDGLTNRDHDRILYGQ